MQEQIEYYCMSCNITFTLPNDCTNIKCDNCNKGNNLITSKARRKVAPVIKESEIRINCLKCLMFKKTNLQINGVHMELEKCGLSNYKINTIKICPINNWKID